MEVEVVVVEADVVEVEIKVLVVVVEELATVEELLVAALPYCLYCHTEQYFQRLTLVEYPSLS